MNPQYKDTYEGEVAISQADSLDRIAAALEVLAKCVWKTPEGDYKFQIEHSNSIFVEKDNPRGR